MSRYQLLDLELQELVSKIHSGKIRLPEFQRSFNWRPKNRRELLDSILKGFPVGTLLLMEVPQDGASPFGERKFEGVPDDAEEPTSWLVLDGQQRLSTCHAALRSQSNSVLALKLRDLFAQTNGEPGRDVDFVDLIVSRRRPQLLERLLYGSHLLPLPYLTDRDSLREQLASYREQLAADPQTADFARFIDVHLQGYLDVLFEYRFPSVLLPADLDVEAVCNIFTKINSTGLRLSAFDLCVATLYPHGENLRERLNAARDDERLSMVDQDGTNILQTVALLAGKPSKKAALPRNILPADVANHWDSAVAGLANAAQVLGSLGVWNYQSVPYDALIPALAATLASGGRRGAAVREAVRSKTARWLFQTALSQRYNEGTDVKQQDDYQAVRNWLRQTGGEAPEFLENPVFWSRPVTETGKSGARARSLLATLNEHGPRDFMTDSVVGRGPDRRTADLHHIFPRAFLARQDMRDEAERVLNLTFLTSESNIFVADRAPSEYLSDLVDRTAANTGGDRPSAERSVRERLATHLISEECYEALLSDDYDEFLSSRARQFISHLQTRFGVRVIEAPDAEADEEIDDTEADPLDT